MSRWQDAKKWLSKRSPLSSARSPGYVPGHEPPDGEVGGPGSVEKQRTRRQKDSVERTTTLPPGLQRRVENEDGVPKPYDPGLLKDLAGHSVAEAYIDTMAQDSATAPWTLEERDEKLDVSDETLAEAERVIEDLHPTKSFRDLREQAARNTLELGDGAWVLQFYRDGGLAEAVPVDSARLFKVVDEHGIPEGYIEVSHSQRDITARYDREEVVWFEWASRTGHVYGQGPTEKGLESIKILEELSEKEEKDLTEGMPPGIVSVKEDEDTPLAHDAYENVKDNWRMKEGERHRAIVTMGDWEFTPLQPGYKELQFLERNKFWIHVLGAVFKVNAPYAGFDFQEGNKAQNQAQAEAYAQRGFRVLLRQMEEAINRQLVWPHISEDVKFTFEEEQTPQERQEQAEYLQKLGDAAEQWVSLGREVSYRDGQLDIEDGEVEEPEDSGGGMGDIFPGGGQGQGQGQQGPPGQGDGVGDSADGDEAEDEGADAEDVEASVAKDGEGLSLEQARKADDILLEAQKAQIWPESLDEIEKRVWEGDESVPEYVIRNIQEAINAGNAVFEHIQSVPEETKDQLENLLEENLTQPQGWSLRSIVEDMQDVWPGVDKDDLEVVARTETTAVLNEARERGYESFPDTADDQYYWQGPSDSRTTEACEELKDRTNPQHGGTPVSMNQLVREEEDVNAEFFENLSFRKHVPHINCRHTFVRHVDASNVTEEDF